VEETKNNEEYQNKIIEEDTDDLNEKQTDGKQNKN